MCSSAFKSNGAFVVGDERRLVGRSALRAERARDQAHERYSGEKAAQIVDELVRRIHRLQDHPQLGRAVPEYGQWQLRELVDKWNRVLYRLRPDAIEIVTIAPARMPLETDAEND